MRKLSQAQGAAPRAQGPQAGEIERIVERTDQRQTWKGFGDGFTQAVEMALIPALMALLGLALDRWLGIVPVLTIVFVMFGMVGTFVRAYYTYTGRIEQQEQERRPWERKW